MTLVNNITLIVTILSSFGFASLLTLIATRRKTKAETRLANAEAKLREVETYSKMVIDFRNQLEFQAGIVTAQGETISNQARQITGLQDKERKYLSIIKRYQITEGELRKKIAELETQLRELEKKYNVNSL